MAKRLSLLFAALVLIFIFLASGCSLTPNRHVYLKYSFFVEPLKNEQIENFVLYLPFPNHEGKIIGKAFREAKERYFKYGAESMDKATWEKVSTKYGPMLKIRANVLKEGVGSGCEITMREKLQIKEYYLWQDTGNRRHPYLYNPRFEVKTKGKQRYAHTMVYSESQGRSGFRLEMRYDISDRAPSPFPYIFGHEWGGDFIAFFGIKEPPNPIPGSAGVPIEIKEYGWKKIPVAECE